MPRPLGANCALYFGGNGIEVNAFFLLKRIYIAGYVQVVVVLFYLIDACDISIFVYVFARVVGSDNLGDILFGQDLVHIVKGEVGAAERLGAARRRPG
mgnify:CR=1 FL=1